MNTYSMRLDGSFGFENSLPYVAKGETAADAVETVLATLSPVERRDLKGVYDLVRVIDAQTYSGS